RPGADAGRPELGGFLVRLEVGDELREVVRRQILARDQDARRFRHQPDRLKIGCSIIERLLVEALVEGVRPVLPMSSVYPSGAALATRAPPAMPAAAPTFSITIDCPSNSPMRCSWIRALTSMPPPAAKGTMSVIGRVGQSCAAAWPLAANTIAAAAIIV